jgi:hypothetical protein
MTIAQGIIEKVEAGEVTADLTTIVELIQQQSLVSTESFNPALVALLAVWLVSIVEAYRVAKKEAYL